MADPQPAFTRRELILGLGAVLVLAVAIVRTAVPDRSRIRPHSVEGLDIPGEIIGKDQRIEREKAWTAPTDVYVVGWNYRIGSPVSGSELILMAGSVRLFALVCGDTGATNSTNPAFLGSDSGYLLRKGQTLSLRYRMTNTGPRGTRGAPGPSSTSSRSKGTDAERSA